LIDIITRILLTPDFAIFLQTIINDHRFFGIYFLDDP
jgi:hypothetical protein